jgi:heme-degrading monooxygenase HmoA
MRPSKWAAARPCPARPNTHNAAPIQSDTAIMITEIAQIDVKPGTEKDFEAAVAKARPLFLRAKGGRGIELHKSIEKPSRYRLMAKRDTLENHTVDFRGSEDFQAWRGLVGQYFAAPPEVEHTQTVLTSD